MSSVWTEDVYVNLQFPSNRPWYNQLDVNSRKLTWFKLQTNEEKEVKYFHIRFYWLKSRGKWTECNNVQYMRGCKLHLNGNVKNKEKKDIASPRICDPSEKHVKQRLMRSAGRSSTVTERVKDEPDRNS